jgi:hypothetical protein
MLILSFLTAVLLLFDQAPSSTPVWAGSWKVAFVHFWWCLGGQGRRLINLDLESSSS